MIVGVFDCVTVGVLVTSFERVTVFVGVGEIVVDFVIVCVGVLTGVSV